MAFQKKKKKVGGFWPADSKKNLNIYIYYTFFLSF